MRKIYEYMSTEEKIKALGLLKVDIIELKQELQNNYPRVVKDAITETLNRYQIEEEWLKNKVEERTDYWTIGSLSLTEIIVLYVNDSLA